MELQAPTCRLANLPLDLLHCLFSYLSTPTIILLYSCGDHILRQKLDLGVSNLNISRSVWKRFNYAFWLSNLSNVLNLTIDASAESLYLPLEQVFPLRMLSKLQTLNINNHCHFGPLKVNVLPPALTDFSASVVKVVSDVPGMGLPASLKHLSLRVLHPPSPVLLPPQLESLNIIMDFVERNKHRQLAHFDQLPRSITSLSLPLIEFTQRMVDSLPPDIERISMKNFEPTTYSLDLFELLAALHRFPNLTSLDLGARRVLDKSIAMALPPRLTEFRHESCLYAAISYLPQGLATLTLMTTPQTDFETWNRSKTVLQFPTGLKSISFVGPITFTQFSSLIRYFPKSTQLKNLTVEYLEGMDDIVHETVNAQQASNSQKAANDDTDLGELCLKTNIVHFFPPTLTFLSINSDSYYPSESDWKLLPPKLETFLMLLSPWSVQQHPMDVQSVASASFLPRTLTNLSLDMFLRFDKHGVDCGMWISHLPPCLRTLNLRCAFDSTKVQPTLPATLTSFSLILQSRTGLIWQTFFERIPKDLSKLKLHLYGDCLRAWTDQMKSKKLKDLVTSTRLRHSVLPE